MLIPYAAKSDPDMPFVHEHYSPYNLYDAICMRLISGLWYCELVHKVEAINLRLRREKEITFCVGCVSKGGNAFHDVEN